MASHDHQPNERSGTGGQPGDPRPGWPIRGARFALRLARHPHLLGEVGRQQLIRALRALRVRVRQGGVVLRLGPHCSEFMVEVLCFSRGYEVPERDLVERYLRPDDRVLELGTGMGLIATLCARRVGSERVLSFEANPALIPVARETFRLNRVAPRLEHAALGPRAGEIEFFIEPDFWASSTHRSGAGAQRVRVPMRPLAEVVAEFQPTFLIVDIEGGEAELFESQDLGPSVRRLMLELHPQVIGAEATELLLARLAAAGFKKVVARPDARNVLLER